MRVAVLSTDLELGIEERPDPEPGPDEVLVRVRSVGICGSDVHYYDHGRIGDYVVEAPLVLGHESAGEVVAVGENVVSDEVADGVSADGESTDGTGARIGADARGGLRSPPRPGDRVALEPGVPCRRCTHCSRGEYNLCPDVTFMATPPDDGAFAEYVAWPADFVHPLPEEVSLREGALIEPLSVGVHVARRAGVDVGDSVLVMGAGPIGLLTAEAVRAAGASRVFISDVVGAKLDRARERGVDAAFDARTMDVGEAVDAKTGGLGVDVVVEASGAPTAIRGTLDAVRRGGTVVLVGLAADGDVPLDTHAIIDNELDVLGSFRYRNTYPAAVDLLAAGAVDVAGIIDFEADLADVGTAFERATDPETVKGMIRID